MAKNTLPKHFNIFKAKRVLILVVLLMFGFACPVYSASMSQVYMAEIIQTQISFDTKITFGDRRYLCLENYPNITQKAVVAFLSNPYKSMGQLFDCEDIAMSAQVRFILTLCKLLPKLNSGIWWHGAPIGIVIFGNSQMKHVVNVIIYNGIAIMYDVGWERIWTSEDIEDSGFWVMNVVF